MNAAATVWETGSPTVGSGPHRLGRSASHQAKLATTQTVLLSWMARSALRSRRAPTAATPASSGKKAGNTASTAPAEVATPFPPRNWVQTGQIWPAMAAVAAVG